MDLNLLATVIDAIVHQKHDGTLLVGDIAVRWMTGGGLSHVTMEVTTGDRWGFDRRGVQALDKLTTNLLREAPGRGRGARGLQLRGALAKLVIERFGRSSPGERDDTAMVQFAAQFDDWWARQTRPRRYLIPCAIVPYEANDFQVGPVRLVHWSRLAAQAEALPADDFGAELARENLVDALNVGSASWVAIVTVDGAVPDRADELADLAVDIAIVAAQLAVPVAYSRRMTRTTARTTPARLGKVVVSEGSMNILRANGSPGLALSGPALDQMLDQAADMIGAVGRRLEPFTSGKTGALPVLDQAWCDGAYWFHEGLAEPLDSVAVAKLETSVEVLLRAESTKGSGKRIRQAICAVTGLADGDFIAPGSSVTVAALAKTLVGARSQVLHGTHSTLSADLGSERVSLETLAYLLLTTTAIAIDRYAASPGARDNADDFLDWLAGEYQRGGGPAPGP